MPGIAGIFVKAKGCDKSKQLPAMLECLLRNPRDTSNNFENVELGLQLGWVDDGRSYSSCSPVWNERRDLCLCLSGEVPGFVPAELVQALSREGTGLLERLSGYFCGVLIDIGRSRALVFVDRYGLKRLYFHESPEALFISTEAKALLRVLPETRRLEEKSLGEFFSAGFVLDNRTIFTGVGLVPGGSKWILTPHGEINKDEYFRRDAWEDLPSLGYSEFQENMKEVWPAVAASALAGPKCYSVPLDGGAETRALAAWAPLDPLKVPCYTVCGTAEDSLDVQIAKKVAQICQQQHSTIRISRNFFSEFPALAKQAVIFTDGAMDVSGAFDLYINRLVRDLGPNSVRCDLGWQVTGVGPFADPEIPPQEVFDEVFFYEVQAGLANYRLRFQDVGLSELYFGILPWSLFPRIELAGAHLGVRLPFLDPALVRLFYQAPEAASHDRSWVSRLIGEGDPRLARIPFSVDMGSCSQATLRASLTSRKRQSFKSPFRDRRVSRQRPDQAGKRLPVPQFGKTSSSGVTELFSAWYRDSVSKYVHEILLDQRTRQRAYLDGKGIEDMLGEHCTGQRDHTKIIHRLLASELIQRQLLVTR